MALAPRASGKTDEDLRLLRRLVKYKSIERPVPSAIGGDMLAFYRQGVDKKRPKMEVLGRAWVALVPELFQQHTCLDGFVKGTLTVLVDSSSHQYELRQLLLAGLEKQLVIACKSAGLKKVSLKRGLWYDPATGAPKF
jgi:hypothetical protein